MTLHQQDRPQSLRAGQVVPLADRVRTLRAGRAGLLMDLLHRRPDGIGLGRGDPDLPTPAHILAAADPDRHVRGRSRRSVDAASPSVARPDRP